LLYKGYTGVFEVDTEAEIIFGRVVGIRDIVTFKGESVKEVIQAFKDSVDDYVEMLYQQEWERLEQDRKKELQEAEKLIRGLCSETPSAEKVPVFYSENRYTNDRKVYIYYSGTRRLYYLCYGNITGCEYWNSEIQNLVVFFENATSYLSEDSAENDIPLLLEKIQSQTNE
jgi:hypothetical protein